MRNSVQLSGLGRARKSDASKSGDASAFPGIQIKTGSDQATRAGAKRGLVQIKIKGQSTIGGSKFQKSFVELRDGQLFCFKKEGDPTPRRVVKIQGALVTPLTKSECGKSNCLMLVKENEKSITIQCPNEYELQQWMRALDTQSAAAANVAPDGMMRSKSSDGIAFSVVRKKK